MACAPLQELIAPILIGSVEAVGVVVIVDAVVGLGVGAIVPVDPVVGIGVDVGVVVSLSPPPQAASIGSNTTRARISPMSLYQRECLLFIKSSSFLSQILVHPADLI